MIVQNRTDFSSKLKEEVRRVHRSPETKANTPFQEIKQQVKDKQPEETKAMTSDQLSNFYLFLLTIKSSHKKDRTL